MAKFLRQLDRETVISRVNSLLENTAQMQEGRKVTAIDIIAAKKDTLLNGTRKDNGKRNNDGFISTNAEYKAALDALADAKAKVQKIERELLFSDTCFALLNRALARSIVCEINGAKKMQAIEDEKWGVFNNDKLPVMDTVARAASYYLNVMKEVNVQPKSVREQLTTDEKTILELVTNMIKNGTPFESVKNMVDEKTLAKIVSYLPEEVTQAVNDTDTAKEG